MEHPLQIVAVKDGALTSRGSAEAIMVKPTVRTSPKE